MFPTRVLHAGYQWIGKYKKVRPVTRTQTITKKRNEEKAFRNLVISQNPYYSTVSKGGHQLLFCAKI